MIITCLSCVFSCDGILFLLSSGILPSLAGVSHVAIQFPAYEKIKLYMAEKGTHASSKLFIYPLVLEISEFLCLFMSCSSNEIFKYFR